MRRIEISTAKYEASIIRPNPDVSAIGPSQSLNASRSGNDTGRIGSTDPNKAGPIDLHRRLRREGHGGQAQTRPWGIRRVGFCNASRVRLAKTGDRETGSR
jgi:hypothetical protein